MQRRNFLAGAALAALALGAIPKKAFSVRSKKIKPRVLKAGDTIALVAPGTAVSDPDDIQAAVEACEYFGLKPLLGKNVASGSGYKTRTREERLEDLHDAFRNEEVNGIICVRGGYGSGDLLDKVDYDLIKRNPKVFVGYSDITALHLGISHYADLVTFHGPVALSSFSDFTVEYFKKALFLTEPIGVVKNPDTLSGIRPAYPTRTIVPGIAEGDLVGGNLSLISALNGTPYEIDTKNKILFIEDVGEEPYRIDRMLTQLRLAGKFDEAAGIVFGKCAGCDSSGPYPSSAWDYSLGEVADEILGRLEIPVFYGLLFGHTSLQATLPLGVSARLDADAHTLEILESATV